MNGKINIFSREWLSYFKKIFFVQVENLLYSNRFVNCSTILMGHSLKSDLRALKIVHMSVIDTSIVYPHSLGSPMRRSLKDLVRTELNGSIQNGEHNSAENACAVVDLIIRKMQIDIQFMHRFEYPAHVIYTPIPMDVLHPPMFEMPINSQWHS